MRRRLVWRWWAYLTLCLAPLLALGGFFAPLSIDGLQMPLFIGGCLSLFVSLRLFRGYKRALFATAPTFDSDAEAGAWRRLAQAQRRGFIGAALPGWIGALGMLFDLEPAGLVLLVLGSLVVMLLYRLPQQLR